MKRMTPDTIEFIKKTKMGFVYADGHTEAYKGTLTVFDDRHLIVADLTSSGHHMKLRNNQPVIVEAIDYVARKGFRFRGHSQIFSARNEKETLNGFRENNNEPRNRVMNFALIEIDSYESVFSLDSSRNPVESRHREGWKMFYKNLWKF